MKLIMNKVGNHKGFTVIEVLIVLAMTIDNCQIRVAPQLYAWENRMWNSVGVPPELARSIAAISFFAYLIWRAIAERESKKRKRLLR
jgi:hypothetical protein